jgi:hypothetical protein
MSVVSGFNRKSQVPSYSQITLDIFIKFYADAIDLIPIYQRGCFRNNIEFTVGLLKTVFENNPIPAIMLYKFQPNDEKKRETDIWEALDGVHRMTVIICFMKGKYITVTSYKDTSSLIMPHLYDEVNKEQILYKETKETIDYIADNPAIRIRYFTDEERHLFNSYALPIQEIISPNTIDERRKIFLNVQNTIPVKNNDLLKNNTDIEIIRLFHDYGIYPMFDIMHKHQHKKGEMYKTQWLCRYFILSIREYSQHMEGWDLESCITKSDTEICSNIDTRRPYFTNIPEELKKRFVTDFKRFTAFIETLSDDIIFSSHMMNALYENLRNSNTFREEILLSRAKLLSENEPKEHRCLWITNKSLYYNWFEKNLNKLESITTIYIPPPLVPKQVAPIITTEKRKPIPKKERELCWTTYCGDFTVIGHCFTCDKDIYYKAKSGRDKSFDCGHILADKKKGKNTADNLRPQCVNCNRSQGIEHMYEFMKREFPLVYKMRFIDGL